MEGSQITGISVCGKHIQVGLIIIVIVLPVHSTGGYGAMTSPVNE